MSEMVRIRMTKLHCHFICFFPNPNPSYFITSSPPPSSSSPITMHHHDDGEDQDRRRHLTYYAHHFRPPQALSTTPVSNPINITYLQEGFHLASAKKRKPDGGARVVQPAGKKDRHSKVRTARGPRDRRLRLSPRTAIQFYDVQDRLGYDRPSKAIDWLIREAQSAIDALSPDLPTNAPPNLIFPNPLIHQHSDAGNPAPGFGGAPPLPAELLDQDPDTARFYQQGLELQKTWAWDCGNGSFSGESPAVSGNGHVFYQREPLQSSFLNYSPMNYTDLGGFNFCNELSNVTAFATMKEDDQNLKSSTPPFLHHHDH